MQKVLPRRLSQKFTGGAGEITISEDMKTLFVHDGKTVGGTQIAGGGGGSGAVSSVAGRTGDVVLTNADVSGSAPLASPTFTGSPKVPTATAGTATTQAASTAFVATAIAAATIGGGSVASVAGRTGDIVLTNADVTGSAPITQPVFTGPVAVNGVTGTTRGFALQSSTVTRWQVSINASDNFSIDRYDSSGTLIDSPLSVNVGSGVVTLTQSPILPTPTTADLSTKGATTAFVWAVHNGQAGTASPAALGTAAVGTSTKYAREDHVHPSDATRAPLASPNFSGTPTVPTATAGTNNTQAASTAFVAAAVAAAGSGGGGGGTTYLRDTGLRNITKAGTVKLHAALSKAINGYGRGRLVFIGDSYTTGYQATAQDFANAEANRFSTQLQKFMVSRGWAARKDSFFGDLYADTMASTLAGDKRITTAGSVSLLSSDYLTLGGRMWSLDAAGGKLTFTPGNTFNTIDVYVGKNGDTGASFDIMFNGSSTASYNAITSDAVGVRKLTYTVPSGGSATSVTFSFKAVSTYIIGATCRMSTAPGLEIINGGMFGTQVAAWATAPTTTGDQQTWNVRATVTQMCSDSATVPTVFVLDGWFNDWDPTNTGGGQTTTQIQTNLTTLINFLKGYGDVIFLGYGSLDPTYLPDATRTTYQEAVYTTAIGLGCPVVDPVAVMSDYATLNTWGYMGDNLHFSAQGHSTVARLLLDLVDKVI